MIQSVRATDKFGSQLFQWDTERHVLSLSHGKEIWFARLDEDGRFTVLEGKPKPHLNAKENHN